MSTHSGNRLHDDVGQIHGFDEADQHAPPHDQREGANFALMMFKDGTVSNIRNPNYRDAEQTATTRPAGVLAKIYVAARTAYDQLSPELTAHEATNA